MDSSQPLYIHLPDNHERYPRFAEWEHGIAVRDLNPYLTESELHNYFEQFGIITDCVFKISNSSGWPKGVGFVKYSSLEEAKAAEEAGPHYLGGFHLQIIQFVTPKMSAQEKIDNPLTSLPCQSIQTDLCEIEVEGAPTVTG